MDLGLRGRAAFVAAASRGLGRAIAIQLGREGADVGICARDETSLMATAGEISASGVGVVAKVADVTHTDELYSALDATADRFGRLDILVVNAGGPTPGTFTGLDDAAWEAAFAVSVMSTVHLIRHALPLLYKSDAASIVVVSSTSVKQPIANLLLSSSVRRAVSGMVEALAVELAPRIRINSVLPRSVRTERTTALAAARAGDGQTAEQVMAEEALEIPLRRYGEPEELARAAVFLASPAASYITGVELPVDGGKLRTPL